MKININEIKFTVRKATGEKKHKNLLAYATITFKGELGEYFSISGFTVWKSKYEGYNVEVPSKPGFKYCLIEKYFWRKITDEIIKRYNYETIPIIEDGE
jgi:hypothetical protein